MHAHTNEQTDTQLFRTTRINLSQTSIVAMLFSTLTLAHLTSNISSLLILFYSIFLFESLFCLLSLLSISLCFKHYVLRTSHLSRLILYYLCPSYHISYYFTFSHISPSYFFYSHLLHSIVISSNLILLKGI